jgi:hypothetical protein
MYLDVRKALHKNKLSKCKLRFSRSDNDLRNILHVCNIIYGSGHQFISIAEALASLPVK